MKTLVIVIVLLVVWAGSVYADTMWEYEIEMVNGRTITVQAESYKKSCLLEEACTWEFYGYEVGLFQWDGPKLSLKLKDVFLIRRVKEVPAEDRGL